MGRPSGLRVFDLYSGAGGFSEGFRQAGFDIVGGIDNWTPALRTHSFNGLGKSYNYDMMQTFDDNGLIATKSMIERLQKEHGRIDVLIGSPPCTEFSYAKNGGRGDIEKGMLLVRSFLSFTIALKPKFWLMENVPRLEKALETESIDSSSREWMVSLDQLGAHSSESWRWIEGDILKIPKGEVLLSSEFGTSQTRLRYIAGHFGNKYVESRKKDCLTLSETLDSFNSQILKRKKQITDPNYPHHKISSSSIRDHNYNSDIHPMYWEHMRHLKRRHIQYGKMSFPDAPNKPARTIMATLNPASREALVIPTERNRIYQEKRRKIYRQPTVREVALLQGFPLDFQFVGNSLSTRYRLVGNAVPCQLAYALALSILDAFADDGYENKEQEKRFYTTMKRVEDNDIRPIMHSPSQLTEDLYKDGFNPYGKFRAKSNRHIRRKIASSKIQNNSAVVVFENTDWIGGKRTGSEVWKSCIQYGVGSKFYQVYLDEVSIRKMIDELENHIGNTLLDFIEGKPEAGGAESVTQIKEVLLEVFEKLDKGIPVVPKEWIEFPGYQNELTTIYHRIRWKKVLPLPSSSKLQELFTNDVPKTGGTIGPIDLFDGLDALVLQSFKNPERNWMLNTVISFKKLVDAGKTIHPSRITKQAIPFISGKVPLISVLTSFVIVYTLNNMYEENLNKDNPLVRSINKATKLLMNWCGS